MKDKENTNMVQDVLAFHKAGNVPCPTVPAFPSKERIEFRKRLIDSEMVEFNVAHEERDLPEVADAIADLIYVLIGTAHEYGIPLEAVWQEVQKTNMAKFGPGSWQREDGKIMKPADWVPPDLVKILKEAGWEGPSK